MTELPKAPFGTTGVLVARLGFEALELRAAGGGRGELRSRGREVAAPRRARRRHQLHRHLEENVSAAAKGPLPADLYEEAERRLRAAA